MMELRPYQSEAIEAFYTHCRTAKTNPVIVIPTAGGKTPILATICRDAVTRWNSRVLVLAHVKELLQQAAEEIRALCPQLPVGVYSASLKQRDLTYSVTVAGIQSIYKRACELGRVDVVIVDEAHLIPESDDGMYRQFLADALLINPKLRILGLTATPYRLKTGIICSPDGVLNEICYEARIPELIRDGYLCPLRTKASSQKIDTSHLHIRAGEFVSEEVEGLVNTDLVVRQAIREILEQTKDRNACLIFCAGLDHMNHVADELKAAGVECGTVSGESSIFERDDAIDRFKAGTLKYLANVNVLTTGFNARNIDTIAMLRPTMSPGLYYQMLGRGFRLHPSKKDCLVLDFAGNVLRHGPVDALRPPGKKGDGPGKAPARECPKCHALIHASYTTCPECGHEFPREDGGARHDATAGSEAVLSGEVTETVHQVHSVFYAVHQKRNAGPDTPRTMRVDYQVDELGLHTISEWVCVEHDAFAGQKARNWWRERCAAPCPDNADLAVTVARSFEALAVPKTITVRKVSGEKFDRIVGANLPPLPDLDNDIVEFIEKEMRRPIERSACPTCGSTVLDRTHDPQYGRDAEVCADCGRFVMWARPGATPADVAVLHGIPEDDIPF